MDDVQPNANELAGPERLKRSPRSRFAPQTQQRMRLEERDEQILVDLFLNRLMTRRQIERQYFSSTVRCNARLRLLYDHQFVARYYPPVAPFGAQAIYSTGQAALPIIARRLEMELTEVKRYYRRTQSPTFIEHTTAIVDVQLAFREAVQSQKAIGEDIGIERWLAEMQCRHEWDIRSAGGTGDRRSRAWHSEAFKPDGFVRLETSLGYHDFFIEVDLGHTSSRQFLNKLALHERYLESALFEQTYGGSSFRTLVFTTGQRRLRNLLALVESKQGALFWFATLESLSPNRVLDAVWYSSLSSQAHELLTRDLPSPQS